MGTKRGQKYGKKNSKKRKSRLKNHIADWGGYFDFLIYCTKIIMYFRYSIFIMGNINSFRNDLKKYDYLNSSILTSKINKLNYNLVTFIVQKELSTFKYVKLTPKTSSYNAQLEWILSKMKDSYGKDYTTYLKSVLDKVDAALESSKLSTKNRFVLLLIKQKLVTELNN